MLSTKLRATLEIEDICKVTVHYTVYKQACAPRQHASSMPISKLITIADECMEKSPYTNLQFVSFNFKGNPYTANKCTANTGN